MSTPGQPRHTQFPSTDPKCILTVARGDAPEGRNARAGGALGLNALSSLSPSLPLSLSPSLLPPPSLSSPPPPLSPSSQNTLLSPSAVASLGHSAKYAARIGTTGKTGDKAAAAAASRRTRYAMQDGARELVPHERVSRCSRYLRKGETHVELLYSPSEGRAHYGCLEVCSSVWLCPVCAAKISEGRRRELVEAVNAVAAGGGAVLHATYTVQHSLGDNLAQLVESFGAAYRRLTGHKAYRALRREYGIIGAVRASEVTHGQNGWHPHYHVLLVLSRPLSKERMDELDCAIRNLWVGAARRAGLSMNSHGFRLNKTGGAVADYIAKYGREPAGQPWGIESELSKMHLKSGKQSGHDTPWDLLRRFSEVRDGRAAHLFREYAAVFKGRQQLVWSPGLRALLGLLDEKTDEEVATSVPDDAEHLLWVKFDDWLHVLRYRQRAELLTLAGLGDAQAVKDFLAGLAQLRRDDRRRRGLDPPPVVPPVQLRLAAIA